MRPSHGSKPSVSSASLRRIEAGEIVRVPLYIVAGSKSEARAQVEQSQGRQAGRAARRRRDPRGGVRRDNGRDRRRASPGKRPRPNRGSPLSPPYLPRPSRDELPDVVEEEVIREDPQPVIETYVQVQVRQCQDDDDPGQIAEGWFSIDGKV